MNDAMRPLTSHALKEDRRSFYRRDHLARQINPVESCLVQLGLEKCLTWPQSLYCQILVQCWTLQMMCIPQLWCTSERRWSRAVTEIAKESHPPMQDLAIEQHKLAGVYLDSLRFP